MWYQFLDPPPPPQQPQYSQVCFPPLLCKVPFKLALKIFIYVITGCLMYFFTVRMQLGKLLRDGAECMKSKGFPRDGCIHDIRGMMCLVDNVIFCIGLCCQALVNNVIYHVRWGWATDIQVVFPHQVVLGTWYQSCFLPSGCAGPLISKLFSTIRLCWAPNIKVVFHHQVVLGSWYQSCFPPSGLLDLGGQCYFLHWILLGSS